MKRAIYAIPDGTEIDALTSSQQSAIASVAAQFVNSQYGTVIHDGKQIVDGIVTDNFDPAALSTLGLDWQLLGLWQWDEKSPTLTILHPMDWDTYMAFVPLVNEYDEQGNVTGSHPAPKGLTHTWSGWPPAQP